MKKVLIGYWPLLQLSDFDLRTPGDIIEINQMRAELLESGPSTHGVMWIRHEEDNAPIPIFIMDDAKAVAAHLEEWVEGKYDRFTLHIEQRPEGYAIALIPDPSQSVARWKQARLMYHEEFVLDDDFIVMYSIIGCFCPQGKTLQMIRDDLVNPSYVGFIDVSISPPDATLEDIAIVGPFRIGDNDGIARHHLDSLFEEASDN